MSNLSIPQSFICPITQSIMEEPVIDYEGNTYEKVAIHEWLLTHSTSPITRSALYTYQLNPNRALKEAIELFKNTEKFKIDKTTSSQIIKKNTDDLSPSIEVKAYNFYSTFKSHNDVYLDICIKTPNGNDIIPKDIVIVVDVSGSMNDNASIEHEGEKQEIGFSILDITKHAINTIIESMNENDRLSLVSYSSYSNLESPLVFMTSDNKVKLKNITNKLKPDGFTNIWDGLNTGLNQFNNIIKINDGNRSHSLMLMTDGVPTESLLPNKGILECLKRNLDKMNIKPTIYTFGFGYDLDTELLVDIAKIGNGCFSFIPDAGFVGTVLIHSISNINTTIARNIELKINVDNNASIKKILGYDNNNVVSLDTLHFGQNKNIIVILNIPDIYKSLKNYFSLELNYTLCDSKNTNINITDYNDSDIIQESLNNIIPKDNNIKENIMRLEFVEILMNILYNGVKNLEKSKELFIMFNYKYKSYNKPISIDLNGQISIAISNANYYNKWGKNYIYSILSAHRQQRCNNFKDVSVNEYGGSLFKEQRDKIDEIFSNMPAPKPSRGYRNSYATYNSSNTISSNDNNISMSMFNNRANGCFHENSLVHMSDGSYKKCKYLVKGDEILTGNLFNSTAIVKCIIKTNCKNKQFKMSCLDSGLIITPYHPIYDDTTYKWVYPEKIEKPEIVECHAIYNIVLDSVHTILLNNTLCVTLGHNYNHDVLYHEFYGTDRVIKDLSSNIGFKKGLIHFMHDNVIMNQGKVIGFDFNRVIYNEISL